LDCSVPDVMYAIGVKSMTYAWNIRLHYVLIGYMYDINTIFLDSSFDYMYSRRDTVTSLASG
jgi:hypothetical protein